MKQLRNWHRWIGAGSAIVVVLLTISGIVLNHASDLGLDRQPVENRWILDRYGIEIDAPTLGYPVDAHWISTAAGQLYFDDRAVGVIDQLGGAVVSGALIFVAGHEVLFLLDADGAPIERIERASLPGSIRGIGLLGDQLLLQTTTGLYLGNADTLQWTATNAVAMAPAAAQTLPPALAGKIAAHARSAELNWERVLLDLHSGRLLGTQGRWIVDAFALALLGLALSGFWIWLSSGRRR